jgi:hypothetical protein
MKMSEREAIIWMVTYEGQTESAYTWTTGHEAEAEQLLKQLKNQYPHRKWDIMPKDVS